MFSRFKFAVICSSAIAIFALSDPSAALGDSAISMQSKSALNPGAWALWLAAIAVGLLGARWMRYYERLVKKQTAKA